jgi:hypothetical protein
MEDIVVFTGPTLAPDEACELLDARYRPPAAMGDVYAVARERPMAIGIIDGYFDRVPSIWHKEILWAMSRGVHVFGSSSMGALRAAELAAFGMVGVGTVFEAFHSGELDNDDEVAVIHGPAEMGFPALSEALVNIRFTLLKAQDQGVISRDTHDAVIRIATSLNYRNRTYERILEEASTASGRERDLQALAPWIEFHRVDQKRDDAVELLEGLGRLRSDGVGEKTVTYAFNATLMWDNLVRSVGPRSEQAPGQPDSVRADDVLDELRLDDDAYSLAAEGAFARLLALEVAEQTQVPGEEVGADPVDGHGSGHAHGVGGSKDEWIREQLLTPGQARRLMQEQASVRRVRRERHAGMGPHLEDHLKVQGLFGRLSGRARQKQAALSSRGLDNPGLSQAGVTADELWRWFFEERTGDPRPDDLAEHAREAGYRSEEEMQRAALRELLFQRLEGGDSP